MGPTVTGGRAGRQPPRPGGARPGQGKGREHGEGLPGEAQELEQVEEQEVRHDGVAPGAGEVLCVMCVVCSVYHACFALCVVCVCVCVWVCVCVCVRACVSVRACV